MGWWDLTIPADCGIIGIDPPLFYIEKQYRNKIMPRKQVVSEETVSYSALVKQLAATQAANAALEIRAAEAEAAAKAAAMGHERTPVSGSFKTTKDGDFLTLTFVCNSPAKVSSKTKSAKQETQALYSQPRGGVATLFDPASEAAILIRYGKKDVRVIGSIGIR